MNNSKFYSDLTYYLKSQDTDSANGIVMKELGNILVKDRESFITLLLYADVPASVQSSDAELIESFIENVNTNRRLMVGAAFLINQKNKTVGFDGEEEISDAGVKAVHKVMYNYFDAYERDEESSNAAGKHMRERRSNAIGGAWAGAVDTLGKLGGSIVQGQQKKKYAGSDALAKKADAKQALIDSVLAQRKAEQAAKLKKEAEKAKLKKILIISSVSLLGVGLIIGGIYLYRKRK